MVTLLPASGDSTAVSSLHFVRFYSLLQFCALYVILEHNSLREPRF